MRLFRRPARLTYATKIVTPEETKADPITPTPETPEPIYQCASCGTHGATETPPYAVSLFGYLKLPHIRLCKSCIQAFEDARKQHYVKLHRASVARKDTLLEQKAVSVETVQTT